MRRLLQEMLKPLWKGWVHFENRWGLGPLAAFARQ
jgi:hypothetical protein